jgi:hypothetical protein
VLTSLVYPVHADWIRASGLRSIADILIAKYEANGYPATDICIDTTTSSFNGFIRLIRGSWEPIPLDAEDVRDIKGYLSTANEPTIVLNGPDGFTTNAVSFAQVFGLYLSMVRASLLPSSF